VVVPFDTLARIPEGLDKIKAAPLLCAGITVFNAMRHQGLVAGDVCAVVGIGGLGHLAVQYANKFGYHAVAVSSGTAKEKLAKELGAHVYIDSSTPANAVAELQKLGGAKLLVCTAPHSKIIEDLLPGLAIGGKALIVSALADPLKVNAWQLMLRKQAVVGWLCGDSRDSEDTLQFSAITGVMPLVQTFKLEDANKAFESMEKNQARFRAVLTMD